MAEITDIQAGSYTLHILHPATSEPIGVSVELLWINDDATKATRRRITDERLRRDARNKTWKSDELEDNLNRVCFDAMRSWDWTKDVDGEPTLFNGEEPEFNLRNVLAVFAKLPWFRDQINEASSDEKHFFKISKPN